MKILIAGHPRAGKTTMARRFGFVDDVRHTDDVIDLGWSEASAEVATWFSKPGPWVIEGVAVPRALRKWLVAHDGKPCDQLHYLNIPFEGLSRGQLSMAKGSDKVFAEVADELVMRGVEVFVGPADGGG